jgi:hypothetical protein
VRIGWMLRTHREVGGLSLRQMSTALREHGIVLSAPTLSRIESEGQRSAVALDGYAAVLGLPGGALRCPVDIVCRSFSYAPAEPRSSEKTTLEQFSAGYDAVTGPAPRGEDWLTFARQHADADLGLPAQLMRPLVHRLADELERGVGTAGWSRYEAMARLRSSRYADVVDEALREVLLDPDRPVIYVIASALSELPTPALARWLGELLSHPSPTRARAASYALQNMLVAGGLPLTVWQSLAPAVVRGWHGSGDEKARRTALEQLVQALPPTVQEEVRRTCEIPTQARRQQWSRDRRNARYEFALAVAREACARRGHREEPLLGRLVFEALFETRGVRMASAMLLVAGSPFAADVVRLLFDRRDEAPDDTARSAVLHAVTNCHSDEVLPGVVALLDTGDPADAAFALGAMGRSGQPVPDPLLAGFLADPASARSALYAAGMAADPRLPVIAADLARPEEVRREAAWWAARSGRILV